MPRREDNSIEMQSAEKNGLLNNTEIRMKDIESIDSDDFLEDDDNEFCNNEKCACIRQRTCIEKLFFVLLFVAVCIILGLVFKPSNKSNSSETNTVCKTKGCIDVASSILSAMDKEANPCQDFYKYACGSWEKNTPIPAGYSYWDRTQELAYTNIYQLHKLIESYHGDSDVFTKTKRFHDSCMKEEQKSKTNVFQNFQDLIHSATGSVNNFTFVVVLEKIHQLGAWPLFTVSVSPDEQGGDQNIIKISQSQPQYPVHVLLDDKKNSTDHKYLEWDAKEVKKRYLGDMSKTLKMFWNKTDHEADQMADKLIILDLEIAKIGRHDNYMFNRADHYNKTTVSKLQQSCSMVEWESYLTGLTFGVAEIKNTDTVAILHEDKLLKLCDLIKSYEDDTENRTVLYYYLLVNTVRSFMPYFQVSNFVDVSQRSEIEMDGELWQRCTFYTNKAFGFATTALYVNNTSQKDNVAQVEQFVKDVKEAFKEFGLRKVWFKGDIRQKASKKIDQMLEKISYPTKILQQTFLNSFYQQFDVENDWFTNLLNWKKFDVSNMFKDIGKQTDKTRWIRPPFTVESDYDPVRNELNFPTAMLHLPFYTTDGPQPFNYGALAALIGHEITHAFDIVGRQYNDKGKLEDWWDSLTVLSFNKTIQCMVKQYDSFTVDGFQINGQKTLDENIADNGGLRAAYFAYQLWERKGVPAKRVPGVDLNDRQIFFLSYAQMFCSKWKSEGLQKHIIDDIHNPGPIRVRGAISNMNTFGETFDCPFISPYNPNSKCEVW